MEYTKGEWKAQILHSDGVIIKRAAWEIRTDEYDIATYIQNSAPIRKQADAQLMAAAPDMYEALKRLEKDLKINGLGVFVGYFTKALAKAEGK